MIQTIINGIAELSSGLLDSFVDGFGSLLSKDKTLKASFGNKSVLISRWNKGFSVTGKKQLSVIDSRNNMIIVSPSGGGKTTTVIYPSVLKVQSSMIINDSSGEISKTIPYLISKGFTIKTLNFGNTKDSFYYNPMHRINNATDVNKVATMLVRANTKDKLDFWSQKAIELISLMIKFIIETQDKEYQNLGNVFVLLELLQAEPETVDALFADCATEQLWRKYKSLKANSENTLASIISSAQASLSFIGNDPDLCNLTSTDTFDFNSLRKEKTVVFLRCPLGDAQYYSTLMSIFFEQFFASVFKELPKEDDDDIFVLIDELSSLHLPNLANIISNSRKFKMPILGVLQSENQLFEKYGSYNAKTILNNANTKIYFSGLTDESIRLEQTLGKYQYEDDKGRIQIRSLMTADEIRTMPKNRVLVIPSSMPPLYCKVTPHYKQRKLVKYLKMQLPEDVDEEKVHFQIQYLSLEKYQNQPLNTESDEI